MIDKTIGVIPPRNELSSFPEKKAENSKEQKSEFESILNQSSRQSKKSEKKERSDQALGGTKKKVQDSDPKLADKSEKTKKDDNDTETEGVDKKRTKKLVNEEMVLSSMASIESANKTPDAEVTPDHLENTNLEISSLVAKSVTTEASVQAATPAATPTSALEPEINQIEDEALASLFDSEQPMPAMSEEVIGALAAQLAQPQEAIVLPQAKPEEAVVVAHAQPQEGIALMQAQPQEGIALMQAQPQEGITLTKAQPEEGVALMQAQPQEGVALIQAQPEEGIALTKAQPEEAVVLNKAQPQKVIAPTEVQPQAVPVDALAVQESADPAIQIAPQSQAQVSVEKQTTEIPVQPQVVVKATPRLASEALVSELVPDQKVLETLNREQMFQKLETMKKTEEPTAQTEARNTMDGISTIQTLSTSENSNSYESADQGQDDFKGDNQEAVQLGTQSHQQSHVAKDFSAVATAQINKPVDNQAADEAGLKEILNQAQYLVTQGGGEVTVKMSPDGMGEVQLKMMLENGKMSLEMNTHDKNVQKLIQDSLSDLKSSLAAHQISVEHVTLNNKISTVQDAQNAQSSQNFTDAHAHHQPQHSHQRDQRQQARQVFEHETMKAIPLAKNEINKASAHRVYQTNKASALNAVA